MNGVKFDVTERKRAESKLREGELLFRELQDAMPHIVWTSDKDGVITHYNRRWYEYTGLTPTQGWQDAVSKEDFAAISDKWRASISSGSGYENEIRLRRSSDGAYRWHLSRAVPIVNAKGTIVHWVGTLTDIDDLKCASQEIVDLKAALERIAERSPQRSQMERKFKVLVESIKDYAIYLLDLEGKVVSWNEGAERLMGYTERQIMGRPTAKFHLELDRTAGDPERQLALAAANGRMLHEGWLVRQDGRQFWASILINAIYSSDGQPCGFSNVVRDLTESRQAEQMLIMSSRRAQEANLAKSSFLAAMSHEIRTPMNAILGMADLLWETNLDPTQREYVSRFRRAGSNLLVIINDILDLSKIESCQFELEAVDFDLLELVDRVTEMATPKAALKNIVIETQVASGTPAFLMGDPVRLQQILNNLIGNATKFTTQGKITLMVGPHEDDVVGHLQFAVADTGIGIPADQLSHIFEDFVQAESSTTRRFGGTGLGLGICRRLVEKMNGTLTVDSVLGKGSTFAFDAAFGIGQKASSFAPVVNSIHDSAISQPAYPTRKLRILLVDDSEDNLFLVQTYLAGGPYELTLASNGQEAVDAVRDSIFDLILTDVRMPVMGGLEAVVKIRAFERQEARAPTTIFALTAGVLAEDIERSYEAGCREHLSKPISKNALISAIERVRRQILFPSPQPATDADLTAGYCVKIPPGLEDAAQIYLRRHLERMPELISFLTDEKLHVFKDLGHNLKGTGGSYGFPELSTLGESIENSANAADLGRLEAAILKMDHYVKYAAGVVGVPF